MDIGVKLGFEKKKEDLNMKNISLLPADSYIVINKTILTEVDRKNLLSLYTPIIGALAVSLYLSLWRDLDRLEIMSKEYTHHHLMSVLKSNLDNINLSRDALESVGLLKTYLKCGEEINNYVYELYSPLSAYDFFNHPIFNIVLYNNVGKEEYENIKIEYEKVMFNLKDYEDISRSMDMTFKSVNGVDAFNVKDKSTVDLVIEKKVDFDLVISSLPKNIINEKTFNKRTKDLINNLAFIYNLDSLKMMELIRSALNDKGYIDKDELRKMARKYYQYQNNGTLPTLVYRTQPEYLRKPDGENSNRAKIIYVFENTSPYDFLKSKNKGATPTARDLKLLEDLIIELELKPAVVNVLIDYVLRKYDNKLNRALVETIAGQWKRVGVETATSAMELAEKENRKYSKLKIEKETKRVEKVKTPVWFNEVLEKEDASVEEKEELESFLKEFR